MLAWHTYSMSQYTYICTYIQNTMKIMWSDSDYSQFIAAVCILHSWHILHKFETLNMKTSRHVCTPYFNAGKVLSHWHWRYNACATPCEFMTAFTYVCTVCLTSICFAWMDLIVQLYQHLMVCLCSPRTYWSSAWECNRWYYSTCKSHIHTSVLFLTATSISCVSCLCLAAQNHT